MRFRRTIALCIGIALISCCSISGALAFPSLTEIFQEIFGNLEEPTDQTLTFDVLLNVDENDGELLFPGREFRKEISVSNADYSTAPIYCWFTYAVPEAMVEKCGSGNTAPLSFLFSGHADWQIDAKREKVMIDGKPFVQFTCIYNKQLNPGETTPLCMTGIWLDVHVGRNAEGYYYWNEDGFEPKILLNSNELIVPIKAYAVNAMEVAGEAVGIHTNAAASN